MFLFECVDFKTLIRIEAIVLPIISWSLFYSLKRKNNRGKMNSIYDTSCAINDDCKVDRIIAKKSLHKIREYNE